MKLSPDFKKQLQSIEGFIPEELENMIENAEVTCLINKDTNH